MGGGGGTQTRDSASCENIYGGGRAAGAGPFVRIGLWVVGLRRGATGSGGWSQEALHKRFEAVGCTPLAWGLPAGRLWASKRQARPRHFAPAAPAVTRPSLPSQYSARVTASHWSSGPMRCPLRSVAWARDKGFLAQGVSAGSRCTMI